MVAPIARQPIPATVITEAGREIDTEEVTEEEVRGAIREFKNNKATGEDEIEMEAFTPTRFPGFFLRAKLCEAGFQRPRPEKRILLNVGLPLGQPARAAKRGHAFQCADAGYRRCAEGGMPRAWRCGSAERLP